MSVQLLAADVHTTGTGTAIIDPTLIRITRRLFFIAINREPLYLSMHYYKRGFLEHSFGGPR